MQLQTSCNPTAPVNDIKVALWLFCPFWGYCTFAMGHFGVCGRRTTPCGTTNVSLKSLFHTCTVTLTLSQSSLEQKRYYFCDPAASIHLPEEPNVHLEQQKRQSSMQIMWLVCYWQEQIYNMNIAQKQELLPLERRREMTTCLFKRFHQSASSDHRGMFLHPHLQAS